MMPRTTTYRSESVGVVSSEIVSPSTSRVKIRFFANQTQRVSLSPGIAAVLDNPPLLMQGQHSEDFTVESDGDIVTKGWNAIAPVAATIIGIAETFE